MSQEFEKYVLEGAFEFPMSETQKRTLSNHLLRYNEVELDLTQSMFNDNAITDLLGWLSSLQVATRGAVTKVVFSSKQLYSGEMNLVTLDGVHDVLCQEHPLFILIDVVVVDDEASLAQYDEVQREIYDSIKSLSAKKRVFLMDKENSYPDLQQYFEQGLANLFSGRVDDEAQGEQNA